MGSIIFRANFLSVIIGIPISFAYFLTPKATSLVTLTEINGIGERCGLKYIPIAM